MTLPFLVSTEGLSSLQLTFLLTVYAYILWRASSFIHDAVEQLLSLYGAGLVGGVVLPMLGAVPEAVLIIYSGIGGGSQAEIQQQLRVGLGVLAGSTVLLLTVGVASVVFLGRRDINAAQELTRTVSVRGRKLPAYSYFSFDGSGVVLLAGVPRMSRMVALTAVTYVVIQVPAYYFYTDVDRHATEHRWAGAAFVLAVAFFVGYTGYQVTHSRRDELLKERHAAIARSNWKSSLSLHLGSMFSDRIRAVFEAHDVDDSGYLDRSELASAITSLGLRANRTDVNAIMEEMDGAGHEHTARDHQISLSEFSCVVSGWMRDHGHVAFWSGDSVPVHPPTRSDSESSLAEQQLIRNATGKDFRLDPGRIQQMKDLDVESEDEIEEEETSWIEMSDGELLRLALFNLMVGACVIGVFAGPTVDCVEAMSKQLGVGAFYIAFLVTPLVSNLREVLIAASFARKKTSRAVSVALSSLFGSAIMNNTLVLSVFLGVVFWRDLAWEFFPEVVTILLVITVTVFFTRRRAISVLSAFIIGLMYPLSLFCVVLLKWLIPQ